MSAKTSSNPLSVDFTLKIPHIVDCCQEKGAFMHKIREFRIQNGLTQMDLAVIIGVSKQSISAYETGEREPMVNTLAKIAIALGTTPDELIEFKKIHDELSEDILEMIQKTKKPIL